MGLLGVVFGNLFAVSLIIMVLSFGADFFSGEPTGAQVQYYGFLATLVTGVLLVVSNIWGL